LLQTDAYSLQVLAWLSHNIQHTWSSVSINRSGQFKKTSGHLDVHNTKQSTTTNTSLSQNEVFSKPALPGVDMSSPGMPRLQQVPPMGNRPSMQAHRSQGVCSAQLTPSFAYRAHEQQPCLQHALSEPFSFVLPKVVLFE